MGLINGTVCRLAGAERDGDRRPGGDSECAPTGAWKGSADAPWNGATHSAAPLEQASAAFWFGVRVRAKVWGTVGVRVMIRVRVRVSRVRNSVRNTVG